MLILLGCKLIVVNIPIPTLTAEKIHVGRPKPQGTTQNEGQGRSMACFAGYNAVHKSRGGRFGGAIKGADWAEWAGGPSESRSGHKERGGR